MTEFCDQFAPFCEQLMQIECFFFHFLLQMEGQPVIFCYDIMILLYHLDGKGDHHTIYAIFLRPSQGGRFKVSDCQDAIEKEGAVRRRCRKGDPYMGTVCQTAVKGGSGQEYGGSDLIP